MTSKLGAHAIVLGAGMGGLSAAAVMSRHFGKVTVIEKDTLPDISKARVGTPQCKLVHVLLEGGHRAIDQFLPGFEEKAVAAGAVRTRVGSEIRVELPGIEALPQRDFGIHTLCMTRPLIEHVLRSAVRALSNVTFKPRCRAERITTASDKANIEGVLYNQKGGEQGLLLADFIVDATSRSDLTLKLLDDLGLDRPEDEEVGVDLTYATAIFELPRELDHGWRAIIHRPDPSNGRGGFLFPIEEGRWHVNLAGVHGDSPSADPDEYLAFAKSLRTQTIYEALENAKMVGTIQRFKLKSSSRRHYETLTSFPEGLVPLGDAICRINPAYGQGMSVAAQEAAVLDRMLEKRAASKERLSGLATSYFKKIQDVLETPWNTALMDYVYPATTGNRPANLKAKLEGDKALLSEAVNDPEMHRLWAEVTNLVLPAHALRHPEIVRRLSPAAVRVSV